MSGKCKTYFLHGAETENTVLYEGRSEAYSSPKDSSIPLKVYFDIGLMVIILKLSLTPAVFPAWPSVLSSSKWTLHCSKCALF